MRSITGTDAARKARTASTAARSNSSRRRIVLARAAKLFSLGSTIQSQCAAPRACGRAPVQAARTGPRTGPEELVLAAWLCRTVRRTSDSMFLPGTSALAIRPSGDTITAVGVTQTR